MVRMTIYISQRPGYRMGPIVVGIELRIGPDSCGGVVTESADCCRVLVQ